MSQIVDPESRGIHLFSTPKPIPQLTVPIIFPLIRENDAELRFLCDSLCRLYEDLAACWTEIASFHVQFDGYGGDLSNDVGHFGANLADRG